MSKKNSRKKIQQRKGGNRKFTPFHRFFNGSMRQKLFISFLIILLVPSIIIGSVSFYSAKQKLEDNMLLSAQQSVSFIHTEINNIMEEKKQDATFLANNINASMLDENEEEIQKIFTQYLGQNQNVFGVYFAREDG